MFTLIEAIKLHKAVDDAVPIPRTTYCGGFKFTRGFKFTSRLPPAFPGPGRGTGQGPSDGAYGRYLTDFFCPVTCFLVHTLWHWQSC